jgi:uncharacterized DUF497 family protein
VALAQLERAMVNMEFDPKKDRKNRAKHGVSLSLAEYLFDGQEKIREDDRRGYGEKRFVAIGFIQGRFFTCIFTWRGEARRIISLRRSNAREQRAYRRWH